MLANLGFGSLVIATLLTIYSSGVSVYGARKSSFEWEESARRALLITFPVLSLAVLCLMILLLENHYEVAYVATVTSRTMPGYLKISALWGGQSGSLLFWSWLMSFFASVAMLRSWKRDRELLPWVALVISVTLFFFLLLSIWLENPFSKLWLSGTGKIVSAMFPPVGYKLYYPVDGNGLNPLLRHPGMILHPPMLYLGFVGFVLPYAFAMAALITGRIDDHWIRVTRRWTIIAWMFLSLGLLLGARWAYDVLGWGGYWGWDPVEIAAFLPWLSGTAFLHSVMIQEKRGMFKQWNMILIILTYALVILGTFLTRSGVLSSVHAFSQSAIGPAFFVFIVITFVVSLSLLLRRWNALEAEEVMNSYFSREALFLLNNLLFMGVLVVCLWGMLFPIISETVTGQKVTVGPPFYERATAPLFGALLLLMGIAPLSAWRLSTIKTLSQTLWRPAILSFLIAIVAFLAGAHNWVALLGFWLVALNLCVILFEFGRGVITRVKRLDESLPLAFWRLAGGNRRRYGGYVIHVAMVIMAVGIIGMELFQSETQATIPQGGEISLNKYHLRYDALAIFDYLDGRNIARAVVSVYKDDKYLGELHPRRDYYYDQEQAVTIPGIRSTWEDDLYVILVDWLPVSSEGATFKVYRNPLVNWLWFGGYVFIFGVLVAVWPEKETKTKQDG